MVGEAMIQFYDNIDEVPAKEGDRIFLVSLVCYCDDRTRYRRWCVANSKDEVRKAAEEHFDDSHIESIDEEDWSD